MGKIKDLTGQKFGHLTVLEATPERRNRQVVWKCQCDCGNITYVVGGSLRNGHTTTCGCSWKQERAEDLTGKRFGKLVVLSRNYDKKQKDRISFWNCQCDCGNTRIVSSRYLRNGTTFACHSCQSTKSIGEQEIVNILNKNNIQYIQQYSFEDCISPNNSLLLFDFAIFKNQQLIELIEYDGIQHFQPIEYFGGQKEYNYRKLCDEIKDNYCNQHHIKLIRIPYYLKGKITINDLDL